MSRFKLIFFVSLVCVCHEVRGAERPNVIVILTDDQGWGDLSCNGNASSETPHIDRLASDGARFQHFYVSPVCSPTRAEFPLEGITFVVVCIRLPRVVNASMQMK